MPNILKIINMSSTQEYLPKPLNLKKDPEGISQNTLAIHHDKLYVGYVNKMKEIGGELAKYATGEKPLDGANQTYSELRALRVEETFAANGVYLHEYYFNMLGGDGAIPETALTKALAEKFGSVDQFIKYFSASGLAMRGWVVLAWDTQLERLKIYGCDVHNQGGVWGCLPIIVLDVYEHAYFIDHGSDRKAYIEAFWKNFDWSAASELFDKINK